MRHAILTFFALCYFFTANAQSTCNGVWGQYLVNQTFGQGNATDNWYGPLTTYAPGVSSSTIFVGAAGPTGGILSDGYSGLAKTPSVSGQGNWVAINDHTGDQYGLMMLINAPSTAATVFFEYTMDDLCPNTTLKLSVWMLNANITSLTTNPIYQYPNMTLNVVDAVTNVVLGTTASGDVPADEVWHQYSIIFNNGASSSIKLQLINNSVGSGYGNDLAIDDITVQPCVPESHILPKLDTTICQSAVLNFDASVIASPYIPAEYQWQYSSDNGATWIDQGAPSGNTSLTFNTGSLAPGTYWVRFKTGPQGLTGNYNCVAVSDTSILHVASFPQETINETLCLGSVYNFYGRYIGLAGTYDTLVKDGPDDICGKHVTLNLTVNPPPDLTLNNANTLDLCAGDTITLALKSSTSGATYQWIKDGTPVTGETGTQYKITTGGRYIVAGSFNGCTDTSVAVQVTVRPLPQAVILYDAQSLCTYDTLAFQAEVQEDGSFYQWAPEKAFRGIGGTEGPSVKGQFTESETVYLTVYSPYGCSATDSVTALVHPCCQALLPTAFSPNNDALNDYFNPVLKQRQLIVALKIFDRYGHLVYDNNDPQKGWNGNYSNGTPANAGVYMYILKYTCDDNKNYEVKGDITLIR